MAVTLNAIANQNVAEGSSTQVVVTWTGDCATGSLSFVFTEPAFGAPGSTDYLTITDINEVARTATLTIGGPDGSDTVVVNATVTAVCPGEAPSSQNVQITGTAPPFPNSAEGTTVLNKNTEPSLPGVQCFKVDACQIDIDGGVLIEIRALQGDVLVPATLVPFLSRVRVRAIGESGQLLVQPGKNLGSPTNSGQRFSNTVARYDETLIVTTDADGIVRALLPAPIFPDGTLRSGNLDVAVNWSAGDAATALASNLLVSITESAASTLPMTEARLVLPDLISKLQWQFEVEEFDFTTGLVTLFNDSQGVAFRTTLTVDGVFGAAGDLIQISDAQGLANAGLDATLTIHLSDLPFGLLKSVWDLPWVELGYLTPDQAGWQDQTLGALGVREVRIQNGYDCGMPVNANGETLLGGDKWHQFVMTLRETTLRLRVHNVGAALPLGAVTDVLFAVFVIGPNSIQFRFDTEGSVISTVTVDDGVNPPISASDAAATTNHTINVAGLLASTTYNFFITSANPPGQCRDVLSVRWPKTGTRQINTL